MHCSLENNFTPIHPNCSACMQVVASKDLVIKEFHAQLKDKDDAYVKLLKQQQEDIAVLLDRMHEVRAVSVHVFL